MKNYKILKNIYICLALFSTVLLVGCSKSDETPISDDPQPSGKAKITFNLHTPGAFLTKAVGVGNENGGTNDKIAFYQFSKEGKYEQRYVLNYAAASVSANGDTRSYTVELTSSTGGEKRFIIVESEDENNFPNLSATNTIDELLNSKTVAESGKLNPPFVMSNVKTDGKEYVTVADVESSNNQVDVKLKRRVARFDLLNDPAESGLVIDKVYIKNRYTQGFIGDVSGNAGNISADVLEIPAADLANDGKSFYLYPTQLTSTLEQNEKTVVWVDDEPPKLIPLARKPEAPINFTWLDFGAHAGTHIDAPYYLFNEKWKSDEVPFEVLIGDCQVVDLTDVDDLIEIEDLKKHNITCERILLKTQNSYDNMEKYNPNHVALSKKSAEYLRDLGIKLIGYDYQSFERNGAVDIHRIFMEKNIVALDNLRLKETKEKLYKIICLPVKVTGIDAAPSRAILIEE